MVYQRDCKFDHGEFFELPRIVPDALESGRLLKSSLRLPGPLLYGALKLPRTSVCMVCYGAFNWLALIGQVSRFICLCQYVDIKT